jgi:hypothetical protein
MPSIFGLKITWGVRRPAGPRDVEDLLTGLELEIADAQGLAVEQGIAVAERVPHVAAIFVADHGRAPRLHELAHRLLEVRVVDFEVLDGGIHGDLSCRSRGVLAGERGGGIGVVLGTHTGGLRVGRTAEPEEGQ